MAETLNINTPGNTISLDVNTVQITTPEGGADFGEVLGASLGAVVSQALLGGRGEGKTGIPAEGESKLGKALGVPSAAINNLVGPLVSSLQTNFDTLFKTINQNITQGQFGAGLAGQTAGITAAREQVQGLAGLDIAKFTDPDTVIKFRDEIRKLGGAFAPITRAAKDNEEGFARLASVFAALETQVGKEDLTRELKSLAVNSKGSLDDVTNGLLEFARRSGKFSQTFGTSLRTSSAELSTFQDKLTFVGRGAQEEAAKLAAATRALGIEAIPEIFTKRLITFEEAANFGADLGVLLGGVNLDLNDFVNALPSERIQMGFGEIASAIEEGRLSISEDGAKFGQQAALFAQQFNIDVKSAETLLRTGRDKGADALRAALESGIAAGEGQLAPEQFAEAFGAQRTTEQAQQAAQRQVTFDRAGEVAGIGQTAIQTIDRLTTVIESEGLLNQLSPFVLAVKELTEIARPFGVQKGAAGGLARAALIGGGSPAAILGETFGKLDTAASELATSLLAAVKRVGTAIPGVGGAEGGLPIPQQAAGAKDALIAAYQSPEVITAIASSMKKAGDVAAGEAVNGISLNGVPKR